MLPELPRWLPRSSLSRPPIALRQSGPATVDARCLAECRLADVTSDSSVAKLVEKSRRPAVTISAQPPPPPPPPPAAVQGAALRMSHPTRAS